MEYSDHPGSKGIPQGKGLVHSPPATPKPARKAHESTLNIATTYMEMMAGKDLNMTFIVTVEGSLNQEGTPQVGEIITFRHDRELAHAISQLNQKEGSKIWIEAEIEEMVETHAESPFFKVSVRVLETGLRTRISLDPHTIG